MKTQPKNLWLILVSAMLVLASVNQPISLQATQDSADAQAEPTDEKQNGNAPEDQSPEKPDDGDGQAEPNLPISPLLDPNRKIEPVPPWEEKKPEPEGFLPDKAKSVRELLSNVDEGELEHLYDYDPIEQESLVLIKILYRMQEFRLADMNRFVSDTGKLGVADIVADPESERLKIFSFRGRVKNIQQISLVEEVAQLFPLVNAGGKPIFFDSYYQVEVDLPDHDASALVCVRNIPAPWKIASKIDEPVSFEGMFLKVNSPKSEPTKLLFAAKRIKWFPESPMIGKTINDGLLNLASKGFDVGLMDDARMRNRKMIGELDGPCFYELIAAANRMAATDVKTQPFDLVELLKHSDKHLGQSYSFQADILRVTEVQIANPLQQAELNLKRYYQLDGMVNTPIAIVDKELGDKGNYGKRFPVTVCVPTLPADMQVGSDRTYQISMPAFFFKIWPYQSQLTESQGPKFKQNSPLMIGLQPVVVSQASGVPQSFQIMMTIVALIVFGFIWFGFWRLNKQSMPTRSQFKLGGDRSSTEGNASDSEKPKSGFPNIDVQTELK